MIEKRKEKKSIQAIQDLIIEARNQAYKKTPHKDLADFLDGIEYLPALIVEDNDNTDLFENFLKELCSSYNCLSILNTYNNR